MLLWTTAFLAILVGLLIRRFLKDDSKGYPLGPPSLPIVGNLPFLKPTRFIAYERLGKTYGDMFTVKLFTTKVVVLNSIKAIRSALVDNGDVFAYRPVFRGFESLKRSKGIIHSDGEHWKVHRRFALKTLKDFGFAKAFMVDAIHEELRSLLDVLEEQNGLPIATGMPFAESTTNVICRLVFGNRFSEDEARCHELLGKMLFVVQSVISIRQNLLNVSPSLAKIPFFAALYNNVNHRSRCVAQINQYIIQCVREHFQTIDESSEPRNLIDALILHKTALDDQNRDHSFTETTMVADVHDLFIAGTDTTAVTLTWGVLLMATHPEIQEKTRSEIHEMLGGESFPTMQDASKLNYTLAVIDEINRFSSIVPTSLMHRAADDVTICNSRIPKDALVTPNLYAVHHDASLWKYPDTFNPGNFLDENGAYKSSENLIHFSLGKRSCLGVTLARMETFVFFVGLMQKYWVSLSLRESIDIEKLFKGTDTVIRHLDKHEIVFHQHQ